MSASAQTTAYSNLRNEEKGKVGPTLWDFEIRNFMSFGVQTLTYTNFRNARKEKVRPAFRDFGVHGFTVFIAKHPTYHNSRIAKKKGTNILGFQVSGSRDFKSQNINHKQFPKLQKEKNMEPTIWDFGI